jgi:NitT/TauT family transport system ATP-binding protein
VRDSVVVDGVGKTYASGVEAIREARFGVVPGEFLSLLGPSGCGKSTLLMMIAGLLAPSRGTIRVADGRVHGPRPDVGIVFQSPVLLPWRTVLDNVLLPIEMLRLRRRDYEGRARALLAMAGVDDFAATLPHELSGGMKQRVAICRALVHDPALLLMDEPFGALDEMTRERLNMELLRIWAETGSTIVFVTHSIAEAVFLSTRVAVMSPRPGRISNVIPIDLPQPRDGATREEPHFFELVTQVREALHLGHEQVPA